MIPYLYFPQDKMEYIPAIITCLLFFIAAFVMLRIFIIVSKREMKGIKELEHKVMLQENERK